jgi:hypothetical protein
VGKRGYSPRLSTAWLANQIRALDGIARVDIIAPVNTAYDRQPTRLKVTSETNRPGHTVWTVFTLPEARKWLGYEQGSKIKIGA